MNINVALVEDDPGIRKSLAAILADASGFRCVGAYSDAQTALAELPACMPHVLLMDINLPGISGIDCLRRLRAMECPAKVLMLTVYDDEDLLFQALTSGANGYLLKRTPPRQLLEAIGDVHRGNAPMSGQIARLVVQYFHKQGRERSEPTHLTHRETEIVELLARGHRYKEIAATLNISFDTVRSHLRNIYEKLHVNSRTEAVVKYLRR
jgi:DNA-binding NarL/FixJ family response regulator